MEVPVAQVVMNEPFVLFDDELLVNMKQYSIEELYNRLLDSFLSVELVYAKYTFTRMEEYKIYQRELDTQFNTIILHASELYRRNKHCLDPCPYDLSVKCVVCGKKISSSDECQTNLPMDCKVSNTFPTFDYIAYCKGCVAQQHHLSGGGGSYILTRLNPERYDCLLSIQYRRMRQVAKNNSVSVNTIRLQLNRIRELMLTRLRKPCLTKEINDLIDELLDSNGNKISLFKDYLTPEHYRRIRAGCDVSEWDLGEQEQVLTCLEKYKGSIKSV
jgi:hypothetical protein